MTKTQLKPALTFLAVLGVVLVVLVPARATTREGAAPGSRTSPVSPVTSSRTPASTRTTGEGLLTTRRGSATSERARGAVDRARSRSTRGSRGTREGSEDWALQRALDRLRDDLERR